MRDISFKSTTKRTALARAELVAAASTITAIREGRIPKGDPLPVAKVAAIMAAKNTTAWIPYCHPIPIEYTGVTFELQDQRIIVDVVVTSIAKTGVEMEAMTAAAAAALTLYDMLKMLDEEMEIVSVRLVEKRGGKSDFPAPGGWTGAVLVVSDRASLGEYEDRSGEILVEGMSRLGADSVQKLMVADDPKVIESAVRTWVDRKVDVILTTGGTGIGPRDVTPEALTPLFDRALPGVVETLRRYGQDRMPTSMLSRSIAGIAGQSLIIALPGSPGACEDALAALFPAVLHAREMIAGGGHS